MFRILLVVLGPGLSVALVAMLGWGALLACFGLALLTLLFSMRGPGELVAHSAASPATLPR